MSKKLIYLFSVVLVLGLVLTGPAKGELVGWWKLDEGSGTTAYDSSGNGFDGTLTGDTKWVAGKYGAAVEVDGDGDYVEIPPIGINSDTVTMSAWIKRNGSQSDYTGIFFTRNMPTNNLACGLMISPGGTNIGYTWNGNSSATWSWASGLVVPDNEWCFVALVVEPTQATVYVNEDYAVNSIDHVAQEFSEPLWLGQCTYSADRFFDGQIDDGRVYDHALTEGEIQGAMQGGDGFPYALGPTPKDGALHEGTWINLSWRAGDFAVSHDVYLGDNFDDVDAGAENTFQGNQTDTFLVAGFPGFAYPDGLIPGTTYYWRIDEVNDTEPNSPWKGDIWSFSIPPKTAYFPDPADSGESVGVDVTLSWTAGFGAKLHTPYFGENFDEVDSAAGGMVQGTTDYTPGTLKMAKTYYWRVDEFDVVETHKGDVWSFTTEGAVAALDPANGAVDVTQTPVLTWSPGLGASHEIYFGADAASLELKGSGNLGSESYDPGQLEWDTTYYWRVDEANNANADSPWTGPLWSFTTANFLIIDDMESYNDLDESDPASNRIYLAWIDGFDNPATNGSVVGNLNAPFAEQTIVHSGLQSMPMAYDNAVGKSEATLTLTSNRDWTVKSVNTLTIWFRGEASNAAETLYVALNDSAVVTNDNPDTSQATSWTQWDIDLTLFAGQGVNLANVNSITLGLGDRSNPVAGGAGMMYFDDIRLYPPAP
jgi:hypothetical protein